MHIRAAANGGSMTNGAGQGDDGGWSGRRTSGLGRGGMRRGRGGERRYSVNLAGENFVFRLRAEGEGEVRSLAAEYEKLRGGMV